MGSADACTKLRSAQASKMRDRNSVFIIPPWYVLFRPGIFVLASILFASCVVPVPSAVGAALVQSRDTENSQDCIEKSITDIHY